ncbi:hypothetical protein KTF24_14180 [Burkholderia multivorans]|uniref:hypothetical protein n=1 Tax=Burkholderia multivorans TaxID=87883 RepID=UPI001C223050|nr:hypothetical protein [Burkholderia multivorans]MBU9668926.1 hypothetical protein [Burkholderia multivorans]HEF4757242.1 hypothetical protein [Burkholderia multivorans]
MTGCRRLAGAARRARVRPAAGPLRGVPYRDREARYSSSRIVRGARIGDPPAVRVGDGRRRTPKTASTPGNRARAFERTQAPERAATQRSNGFVSAPASGRGYTDAENA